MSIPSIPSPQAVLGTPPDPSELLGEPPKPPRLGGGKQGVPLPFPRVRRAPRAPGRPSAEEERVKRSTPKPPIPIRPGVTPQPNPAPPRTSPAGDDRPRTPAGAPADFPRRIPKTGQAEGDRDALKRALGRDLGNWFERLPVETQDRARVYLRHYGRHVRRAHDDAGRQAINDLIDRARHKPNKAAVQANTLAARPAIVSRDPTMPEGMTRLSEIVERTPPTEAERSAAAAANEAAKRRVTEYQRLEDEK